MVSPCGLALSFVRVCVILAVAHSCDLGVLFNVALLCIGFLHPCSVVADCCYTRLSPCRRGWHCPFLLWFSQFTCHLLQPVGLIHPSPCLLAVVLPATLRRFLWSLRLPFRFERPLLNIIRPHARSACLAPAHNLYSCFFA